MSSKPSLPEKCNYFRAKRIGLGLSALVVVAFMLLLSRDALRAWWLEQQPTDALRDLAVSPSADPLFLAVYAERLFREEPNEAAMEAAIRACRASRPRPGDRRAARLYAIGGYLAARFGDAEVAGGLVDQAKRARSDDSMVPLAWAILLTRTGDHAGARKQLEIVAAREPHNAEAWTRLGTTCLALGENEAAVEALRKAVELKPDEPASHADLAEALGRLQRFRELVPVIAEAIRLDPQNPGYRLTAARAMAQSATTEAEYRKAVAILEEILQRLPDQLEIRAALGGLHFRFTYFAEAISELERCIAQNPNLVTVHYMLSLARERAGDVEGARSAMARYDALIARDARAVELGRQVNKKPSDARLRFRLSQTLFEMGHVRPAYEHLVKAGELAPEDREIRTILELARRRMEQQTGAGEHRSGNAAQ